MSYLAGYHHRKQMARVRRGLREILGMPRCRDVDAGVVRRKVFLACLASIGIPLFIAAAWIEWHAGARMTALLFAAITPLMFATFSLVRADEQELAMSRILAAALGLLLVYSTFQDGAAVPGLYLLAGLPAVFVCLFGSREGLCWSAVALAVIVAMALFDASGGFPRGQFVTVFVLVTLVSAFFDEARLRAQRLAQRQKRRLLRERRRLQQTRQHFVSSQQRLRQFAEIASDWFIELDAELRVSEVSANFEKLTGIPAGAMYGLSMLEFAGSFEGCDVSEHQATLRAHRPFRDFRYALTAPDGRRVFFMTRGDPMFDEQARFRGYICTGADTTQHEQDTEEIHRKDRQIDHIQKLGALGQLTSGVAHDFNNLLTVIQGNLEFLKMDDASDQESVDAIACAVTQASGLTTKLLSFSRREAHEPEPVGVKSFLEELLMLVRHSVGERIEVSLDISDGVGACFADRNQLACAVINLALNARDAMRGRGSLVISARQQQLHGHPVLAEGSYVRLSVIDEGEGMDQDTLGRVVEPFFTTKADGDGTGLGLSMVQEFATRSGGGLNIDSAPGIGTCVSVYLPLSGMQPSDGPKDDMEQPTRGHISRTVLMVEDEISVQKIVGRMLDVMGYRTVVCSSAEEALARISESEPQLLLTDMMLGSGMSGIELADRVRAEHPDTRVLLMSGYPEEVLRRRGNIYNEYDLLRKPFGYEEISNRIDEAFLSAAVR